ncbi:hypothetical protein R1sor_017542 [Riccia sorocarpa]|uniref:LOV domain-containing protein n=1 Tax=Riccia sorocarpa TaxID=122646 RepID=A0ABD3IAR2_9MARC
MEDPDHVRDCTRRHFYEPVGKVSRYRYWATAEKQGRPEEPEDGEHGIGLLGADQILTIIQHLPIQSIIAFGMTCKRYKAISETDALWVHVCKREWGSRAVDAWPTSGRQKVGWKGLYRQMLLLGAAAWQRMQQGPVFPTPRASHTMNVVKGKVTIFGGGSDGGRHLDDTWVAPVPEPVCAAVQWQLVCSGLPSGRFQQSCTAVGDELLLFGGINDKGTRLCDTYINTGEVVQGDGGRPGSPWQLLEVSSAPPPRGAHAGCYAGDRKVVIFGGIGADGTRMGDTWILDLAANPLSWQEVITPVSPQPRGGHTLTWIGGKRLILFGGRGSNFEVLNDVWMLDLEDDYPSWVELQSSVRTHGHDHPTPRSGHSATLIFGGRILIFGGEDSKRARKGDVWVLDPTIALQARNDLPGGFSRYGSSCNSSSYKCSRRLWKKLEQWGKPPSRRSFHGACSIDSGQVLVFGGMVDADPRPTSGSSRSAGLGFDSELYILQLVP